MAGENFDSKLLKNASSGQILKFLAGTPTYHLLFRGKLQHTWINHNIDGYIKCLSIYLGHFPQFGR